MIITEPRMREGLASFPSHDKSTAAERPSIPARIETGASEKLSRLCFRSAAANESTRAQALSDATNDSVQIRIHTDRIVQVTDSVELTSATAILVLIGPPR